jgi:propanediol utilization protein
MQESNNHFDHYNIDDHTKEKHCKLHIEMNPDNCKQEQCKKKNLLSVKVGKEIKRRSYVVENVICAIAQKETNLSSRHHNLKKEMTNLLYIKI